MTGSPEDFAEYVLSHPARWDLFVESYGRGYADGLSEGYRRAGEEWTGITTLACRLALPFVGLNEARARRERCAKPALTAEEIRRGAEASWDEPVADRRAS